MKREKRVQFNIKEQKRKQSMLAIKRSPLKKCIQMLSLHLNTEIKSVQKHLEMRNKLTSRNLPLLQQLNDKNEVKIELKLLNTRCLLKHQIQTLIFQTFKTPSLKLNRNQKHLLES
jgi:hypothetical protein